jgi:outer membrane immunogenic protein
MALAAFVLAAPGPIDIRFRGLRADSGIPPTVAETSQPKRAGPGKEIDTQILERGVQMKRLFLGSVALAALGMPGAFAADRPVPAYAPPPPPAYTWSGCYVGASAGNSSGTSEHIAVAGSQFTTGGTTFSVPAGTNIVDKFDLSGFIGGFQGGCNWQWGAWVFGIEGDGSATNKEGQGFETPIASISATRNSWISQTQERWLVTARGRLGLTNFWWFGDKTLVYVTGGGAWAKIDVSEFLTINPQATGHQESNTRSGWTAGAGIEYALGYGWSAKAEYLYVDFGTFGTFTSPPFASAADVFPREVKLQDHIFRAGMNYKFW